MNYHVGTVFHFHTKAVGRSLRRGVGLGGPSRISSCVSELVIVRNYTQDLGFSVEAKSVEKVPCHTTWRAAVDTGRAQKRCMISCNSTGYTSPPGGSTPRTKCRRMHDIRKSFPPRISLPIPVGNVNAFASSFLQ